MLLAKKNFKFHARVQKCQTAFSKVQISLLSMRTFFSRSDKILYLDISTSFVLDNLKWPNKRYHSVSAIGAKNSNVCLDIFLEFTLDSRLRWSNTLTLHFSKNL